MTDYKAVFRTLELSDVEGSHIQPTPRWDLKKVYVFTKDIPTNQLRADLEERVGVKPTISDDYAIQSILYVFQTELPEKTPAELRDGVAQMGLDTNAVFIRGATNPSMSERAEEKAGKLLYGALQELFTKYGNRIHWRFKEAKGSLDTCAVLVQYDKELAMLEYRS